MFSPSSRHLGFASVTDAQCASVADHRLRPGDYYYSSNSPRLQLSAEANDLARLVMPAGRMRTGYKDSFVHQDQKSRAIALPKAAWPRSRGRSAWPSSPNFNEILEMSRRGITPADPKVYGDVISVPFSEFNNFSELVIRTVSRSVIGIRADVRVPPKWLGHFRYRWNFLILTAPTLPIGLARFLLSKWLTDPYSLWLERRVSLKSYLRQFPVAVMNRAVEALARSTYYVNEAWSGSSLSTDSEESESDSDDPEFSDDSGW